ncbi:MBL fold metallo-hydrolase [Daejeonella sp. H1SJ63]|jgi:putative mRNA 3-end processing factor|uniref:MBL fold metallo-hydrolase n=1 Tax=Daejeonella sp. H1SJ63 TaxID=3034145 RepID=UPI0023EB6A2F|nr:MBL fold metallo-hydrolase [Daejeonella sp. H1SJ63]
MIIEDFLFINEQGLYCSRGDFYLDPQTPVAHAVISHAHGDHAVRGNNFVYCTAATAAFMQHRYQKQAGNQFNIYNWSESFVINGVKISFIPAGHILGSAQVLMEYEGVRYLYTGDYKLQEDSTCERLEFVKADVLITETTFADPEVRHPDAASEIMKFNAFNHNILLGAYSLGKAQRLISLINRYCPERSVVVHHSIFGLNKIYDAFGYSPGKYEIYNRKSMKLPDQNMVYIVPPLTFNSYIHAKNVVRAFASGWMRLQVNNDMQVLISDHVDWNDILKMVSEAEPHEVWTLHGNGNHLKRYFKDSMKIKMLNYADREG